MQQATEDFPHIKLFIYMDSDAVVDSSNLGTRYLHTFTHTNTHTVSLSRPPSPPPPL